METEYLLLNNTAEDEEKLRRAAELIKSGGLVAIPTETVYGLGASALDDRAVERIFEVKGRPQDNPLILHVAGSETLEQWCTDIPETAYRLTEAFWPGPLTLVLRRNDAVPDRVTAGMDTVAVRCPDHSATRRLIELAGVPVAAPSANLSGKPSTTSAAHVLHDIGGRIEAVVDGGECRVGLESTIVDLTVTPPRLLRPGGVSLEELEAMLGPVDVDPAVYRRLKDGEQPKAPGMKYRHYSPNAPVTILDGTAEACAAYIHARDEAKTAVMCFDGENALFRAEKVLNYGDPEKPESLGEHLFACLRELDCEDIEQIYVRCPPRNGVGLAVYNRLSKAAGNTIIEV